MQCLCAFSLRSGEPHMGIKSWDPCCWRISGHVGRPSSEWTWFVEWHPWMAPGRWG